MRILFLLALLTTIPAVSFSQSVNDALRYSFLNRTGTARYTAMGGAFSSLGGDFSAISVNPAAVSIYNKNEFTISPSFYSNRTESNYLGEFASDDDYKINFNNLGFVLPLKAGNRAQELGWQSFSLGFGYTRTNNFNSNTLISGFNSASSLLDVYSEQANGMHFSKLDQFGSGLAWQTFLIDTIPGDTMNYRTAIPYPGVQQLKSTSAAGTMGETSISFGGNYNDNLYLGAAVGITGIRYAESSEHQETTPADSSYALKGFVQGEELRTHGKGYNVKLGAIYRITDWFRIGAGIHSPTFFNLTDNWSTYINATYNDGSEINASSPEARYNYNITTPWRGIGSLGFVIAKKAIVSAEYEHIDYSAARIRSSGYSYNWENSEIKNTLTTTGNIRAGAEYRLDPFSIRAGYVHFGNPLKSGNMTGEAYSAGFGIRQDNYFVDLSYQLAKRTSEYLLYNSYPVISQPARLDMSSATITATVGVRF